MSRDATQKALVFEKPCPAAKPRVLAFAQAFYSQGEKTINGSAGLDFYPTYEEWLAYLGRVERGEEEGFVPSQVWLARNEAGDMVGILDIRPTLPESKLKFGHIGYAVAPAHRRRGHATHMLRWGTARLQAAGVNPVVACCHAQNIASVRTLERGGYRRTGSYIDPEEDDTVLVFWHT